MDARYLIAPHTAACIATGSCEHPEQPAAQPRQRHYNGRLSTPGKSSRRAGSARFATYWKVQLWEARSLTWKDVQKAHDSEEAAWAAAPEGARLMEVSEAGRRPITR